MSETTIAPRRVVPRDAVVRRALVPSRPMLREPELRSTRRAAEGPAHVPTRTRQGGPGRPRTRGARPLAPRIRVPEVARGDGGRTALDLLRGPAYRERHARHAPRRGARVQGRLPALQDDEGLPRRAAGRLGLPRPAGRARG